MVEAFGTKFHMRASWWKFIQMSWITWPRWLPCPYMVKTFENLLLQNQRTADSGTCYVVLGTQVLPRLFKCWPWVDLDLFHCKALYGKMLIHRILWKFLKILGQESVIRVVLMNTWRSVGRRGQGHYLTFDPGLTIIWQLQTSPEKPLSQL